MVFFDQKISRYSEKMFEENTYLLRLVLISAPDISASDILARTFYLHDFLACFSIRRFQQGYIFATWTFDTGTLRHWDISAQGYFGTWMFWHMYILALCKAI